MAAWLIFERQNAISFVNKLLQVKKVFLIIVPALIALASIITLQLPLLNILGFEYSIFSALLLTFFCGLCTAFFLKWNFEYKKIAAILSLFTFIPLILGYLNSFLVKNCSLLEGIEFYFVFTGVAVVFGTSIGFLSFFLNKKYSPIIFVLFFLTIFIWSVVVYYFHPQLFLFNPIYGFFPGFVYDEDITLTSTILLYRVVILLISMLIILTCHRYSKSNSFKGFNLLLNRGLLIITSLILCLMLFFSDDLGFSTSLSRLEKNFNSRKIDERFEFHFESDSLSENQKKIIKLETDFHFEQLTRFFQTQPKKIIKIFLFESDKSKKKLLGTAYADFTKPWLYQIFLTRDNFKKVIKHELAHIFSGEYSENLFHVAQNFNLGLVEGAAMAGEWDWNDKEPHFYASNIFRFIGELNPAHFFRGFNFAFKPSAVSYIISGSFARFLIDEYGIEKFGKLYATGDFANTYGINLSDLSERYLIFIKSLNTKAEDSLSTEYYFKRQSLFEKECLRTIAKKTNQAYKLLTEKKYLEANLLFRELWGTVKTPSIAYGILYSNLFQKKYKECIDYFEKDLFKDSLSPNYVSSYLLTAFAYGLTGRDDKAKMLLDYSLRLNLNQEYNNAIQFRLKIIESKEFVQKYLFHPDQVEFAKELLKYYSDDAVVMTQLYKHLTSNERKKFFSTYSGNFWVFEKQFFSLLDSGDFLQARTLVEVLQQASLSEIEKSKLMLMKYILSNI
ncbi:MAG: hypothetical protein KJ666_17725 [Bacteroidetes bacterium]|nr:hypothetical protein [Bacteroidota bacterium]